MKNLNQFIEDITLKATQDTLSTGIPTGFAEIDRTILGFQKKMVYLIGGIPSSGKSSFITNTALFQAKEGYKVLYFTMNEPVELVLSRIVSIETNIPIKKILSGFLTGEELNTIQTISNYLKTLNLEISNTCSFEDILEKLDVYKPDIVYIDNLFNFFMTVENEVAFESLKRAVIKENISLVVVDNAKKIKDRKDKRPQIEDLQHFFLNSTIDNYILIHRPSLYNFSKNFDNLEDIEVIIAKSKLSERAVFNLLFHRDTQHFEQKVNLLEETDTETDGFDLFDIEDIEDSL